MLVSKWAKARAAASAVQMVALRAGKLAASWAVITAERKAERLVVLLAAPMGNCSAVQKAES